MPTVASVIADYQALNPVDQKTVKSILLSTIFVGTNLKVYMEDKRFINGRVCPHCGTVHVVRNGKRPDGTQRFKCMDCGKRFVITTNSVASGSRKDLSVWEKYIDCMLMGLSLKRTAGMCGICKNTAFLWRHKILDALQALADTVMLDGIVEADETFFPISYKGKHKTFKLPRKPRKHGLKGRKRGLSSEQICVPCAIDRSGQSIAKISNVARIKENGLQAVYGGRIAPGTNMVTDGAYAYRKFASTNSLTLHQVKGGKGSVGGIYHIQHINSYHSQLKGFIGSFRGVSTKYLNNYLVWHNFINYKGGSLPDKRDKVLTDVLSAIFSERNIDVKNREALPILA